jgi:uncharacterized protein (DUF2235 family)
MERNIIIFSDGTGQAGGFRFDESRSNIYKMFRACRCGPDSSINPREQLTFYDPGLGSQADGGHLGGKISRWIYNTISQATGFGITANIIDCYAALIRLWRPGDRIFLFGFSRGAYTIRCLAGVISMCGIPQQISDDLAIKLTDAETRKLAGNAVKHVYQFTSSRKIETASERQRFMLETRKKLAARFRAKHNCGTEECANVDPYFIGVFDTVAALGSFPKSLMITSAVLVAFAAVSAVASYLSYFSDAPLIGGILAIFTFWRTFFSLIGLTGIAAVVTYIYTHLKWDVRVPEYDLKDSLRTFHLTEMWQTFYDTNLNPRVNYAKHAISIDENRKDFARVAWGRNDDKEFSKDAHGNRWFEQVWFAGNHSDIGGSYPENESRLSDIALTWMVSSASVVPDGLKYNASLLRVFPHPEGMQHDEVKSGLGLFTKLTGRSWPEKNRKLPTPKDSEISKAVMHRSVYKRFDLADVQVYDLRAPYRPDTLQNHVDFMKYYEPNATFPADSSRHMTTDAAQSEAEAVLSDAGNPNLASNAS